MTFISKQLESWNQRRAFRKLISAASRSASVISLRIERTETKHFQFIVVSLDDSNPDKLSVLMSKVIDSLFEKHATLMDMNPSLMIAVLGVPFPETDRAELRAELVNTLLAKNGHLIRIAHGHCEGLTGLFGGEKRCTWNVAIPRFSSILKRLLDTPFGTAIEIAFPKSEIPAASSDNLS